ncbi:MAG: two pore domain potassium channel family protein [Solirubrobacteraceae bacterium]|nr:two pore domain potassium channel family protein [Solirubrobacteraceae bacterium]
MPMSAPPREPGPFRETFPTPPGALRRTVLHVVFSVTGLLVLYSVLPVPRRADWGAVLWLLLGLAVFVALTAGQVRMIVKADHPRLRAVEALGLVGPVLLFVFAYTYLTLSTSDAASFTEPLSRIDAVYFAMTVLSTTGFGDIAAKSEPARLLVTIQILVGLLAAVGLARLLLGAADIGLRRSGRSPAAGDAHPRDIDA